MKSKEERHADYERREAERKAKYARKYDDLKAKSDQQRAEREAFKASVREQKRQEGYNPSFGWIICGVLFPPLGAYQIWRLLIEQHRATKETRQLARRIMEQNAQSQRGE